METADYERCRSEELISPKRMKILERIIDERLKQVVKIIKEYRLAVYQEMLIEELIKRLKLPANERGLQDNTTN